jgi:hypothetical protein
MSKKSRVLEPIENEGGLCVGLPLSAYNSGMHQERLQRAQPPTPEVGFALIPDSCCSDAFAGDYFRYLGTFFGKKTNCFEIGEDG